MTIARSRYQDDKATGENDDDCKIQIPGGHLIDQYLESRGIIQKQMKRITRVTTDQHLLELVNHQKALSQLAKEYDIKCSSDDKEVAAADEEYDALRQQRVELQEKIKVLVSECNLVIDKENM